MPEPQKFKISGMRSKLLKIKIKELIKKIKILLSQYDVQSNIDQRAEGRKKKVRR